MSKQVVSNDKCVFCKGEGKFLGYSARWNECYCVSAKKATK